MKIINKINSNNNLIKLHSHSFLEKQRVAGKVVAETLILLQDFVNKKTNKSLIELNKIAEEYIYDNKCIPTFKNYKSFPAGVCMSVNKKILHGIPTDYILDEGDVITFDLGATYNNAIADSATTCLFGYPKSQTHVKLINSCSLALAKAIESIKIGNNIGCIGSTISKIARKNSFGIITDYGGHGISTSDDGKGLPHAAPFISNKASENEGVIIQKGMTFAIEPIFTTGGTSTKVDSDGWTVIVDADMGCHEEHSLYIHEDHTEVLTWRINDPYLKTNKIYW